MVSKREADDLSEQIDEILDRTVAFSEDKSYTKHEMDENQIHFNEEEWLDELREGYHKTRDFVIEKPLLGVGIACAAGFLAGFLWFGKD